MKVRRCSSRIGSFGVNAGASNTTGFNNTFVGHGAGAANSTACCNSFFGAFAGQKTTTADANSFFGWAAGINNTGFSNSFFGRGAGFNNTTASDNSFFGRGAGFNTTIGGSNSFFGRFAGTNNTTGINNTFIGANAGNPSTATQVSNSTTIGFGATVSTSNTIVIGRGTETTRIPGKVILGSGVVGPIAGGGDAELFNNGIIEGLFTGNIVLYQLNNLLPSPVHLCIRATSLGGGFGGEGLTRCTTSSSSSTFKSDLQPFVGGLDVINRLKPMTFTWKEGGMQDVGLSAEDVAEVEPLLVTRNDKGEVEDVKEGTLNVLFVNAFKEQQKQIEHQRDQLQRQQLQLDALKKLVCQSNPQADVCK